MTIHNPPTIQLDDIVISLTFTNEDVIAFADELGIDPATAVARADSWASAIQDTACALIMDQLESVIEHDTP